MQRLAFLDLDDTLLDTSRFKQELWQYFARETGCTLDEVSATYEQTRVSETGYTIEGHLSRLYGHPIVAAGAHEFVQPVLQQLPTMLFTDVSAVVARVRAAGYSPRILTKGNLGFQQMKLDALHLLVEQCDGADIVPEERQKGEFVCERFGNLDSPLLVDDKISTLTEFRQHFSDSLTFSTIKEVITHFEPKEVARELSPVGMLR